MEQLNNKIKLLLVDIGDGRYGKLKFQFQKEKKKYGGWLSKNNCLFQIHQTIYFQVEIWVKAVDSNYNTQPENVENIWNMRGVLNNSYDKINIKIKWYMQWWFKIDTYIVCTMYKNNIVLYFIKIKLNFWKFHYFNNASNKNVYSGLTINSIILIFYPKLILRYHQSCIIN